MVLDEPGETDDVFKVNGFTYVVDRELMKKVKELNVDYVTYGNNAGFTVTSQLSLSRGCDSCSC
jgi:Fe-S cluster assembly iron-binding protein IscA